ncbi:hypothetical protein MKQ68_10555 [Chitinophaga horti]|uniref:Alpha-L-rhamnosidase n=1 Tax=Chitinophaga horti TaxID=2920382 RepID=A0ABY6J793_9BACT|nr:hypothetical protein [Chitinophaga horti]UYQ95541.1 hypothetical protein MKQ68_10555 [Chitinophaga horti]
MKRCIYILIWLLAAPAAFAQVKVTALRSESPEKPMLSWQLESKERGVLQTAYQVIVSSSKEKLARDEGDLWNSKVVKSEQSLNVPYAGVALSSRQACFWKVKVWTNKGISSWSAPAAWSVGLLELTDWKASWIGWDKASPFDSVTQWSHFLPAIFVKPLPAKLL